jgi:type II secretory pathway pseudopilin PulG
MSNQTSKSRPTPLGIYDRPVHSAVSGIETIAIVLSVIWLIGAAIFFLTLPDQPNAPVDRGGLRFLMTMLAIFMPVAMIWVAATAARASRVMREESQRLQTAIDAIRQAYIAQSQGRDLANEPSVSRKLDEIAAAAPVVVETDDQPALALGTTAEDITPPLATEDFIRAMNFPETAEDEVGFAALRRALKNREASQLIQAAQDVLTLLSQDGIYMDDLRPDRARPEIWRQFAGGTRGRPVAALGGVRDRSSLVLTSGRMKQDPIFRDAAHHFLRRFDKVFAEFEPRANDSEISALSDTRTARAFMLLGRVAGTFD